MGHCKSKQVYSLFLERHLEEGRQALGKDTYTEHWNKAVTDVYTD